MTKTRKRILALVGGGLIGMAVAAAADTTRVPSLGTTLISSLINTFQTPDTMVLGTNTLGNSLIIAEAADAGFDFAHPQQTDPTLFIHSRNQSTTEWGSLRHDGSAFIINGQGSGVQMSYSGTPYVQFGNNRIVISNADICIGATISSCDTSLARETTAVWQLGQDIVTTGTNYTLKSNDGIVNTDVLGGGLTLAAGRGTGAAVSNPLILNRQVVKATGTTAQTYAPAVIVCPTKNLSTTSAVAQTIATITTTSTSGGIVTMDYGNVACSGSTCDADSGLVKVAWNNNAGTVAAAMTAVTNQADSDATGTLAATPTATVATNVVSIKLTPTWVTIVPTSVFSSVTFTVHSILDTVVCQ